MSHGPNSYNQIVHRYNAMRVHASMDCITADSGT
jgi:hypothetical protein